MDQNLCVYKKIVINGLIFILIFSSLLDALEARLPVNARAPERPRAGRRMIG
jgi:hypothetical protein